jgi:outer membrane protein assembly factor BamB
LKEKKFLFIYTLLFVIIYSGLIIWWHVYTPVNEQTVQIPGADNRPYELARTANDVVIGEYFMRYENITSSLKGKWSCFRGEMFDNKVGSNSKINVTDNLKLLWSVTTGEGHAAPVIYNGMVYFLDYIENLNSDALRCFSLETGKELWRRWYRVPMKRNHGFSRTVPAVNDKYIITIGPQGHVMCCELISGDLKWTLDMQKEFQTEVPFWYAGQCPRIDENVVVLAPAGKDVLLAGLDCETGKTVWQTPNSINYRMSHSSVTPMTLLDNKMYVYAGIGGVCGISADKKNMGELLWNIEKWQPSVIAPSPLQITASDVVLLAGYGAGGALLRVSVTSSKKWTASIIEQYKPSEGLSSEQQTPILYNNLIIGVLPKDGGINRGKIVCHTPSNLRQPVWASAADERFGLGPYMILDNKLIALKDDGELFFYEIHNKGITFLRKQKIMDPVDAWGPMAYADGYLIIRDSHNVQCLYFE